MSQDTRPDRGSASEGHGRVMVPLAAERASIGKVRRERGKVSVHVATRVHEERFSIPLASEHTELRRVRVDRFVDAPPPVRQEGDVIIVPLVEEVLVVQKRLKVREEIHLIRHTETHREQGSVALRSEHATLSRKPPDTSGDGPA